MRLRTDNKVALQCGLASDPCEDERVHVKCFVEGSVESVHSRVQNKTLNHYKNRLSYLEGACLMKTSGDFDGIQGVD